MEKKPGSLNKAEKTILTMKLGDLTLHKNQFRMNQGPSLSSWILSTTPLGLPLWGCSRTFTPLRFYLL